MALSGCDFFGEETHSVRYRITGTVSRASVFWTDENGEQQKLEDRRLPWQQTVQVKSGWVRASAVIGNYSGRVTVEIEVDGRDADSETGYGPFAVVTADYKL